MLEILKNASGNGIKLITLYLITLTGLSGKKLTAREALSKVI